MPQDQSTITIEVATRRGSLHSPFSSHERVIVRETMAYTITIKTCTQMVVYTITLKEKIIGHRHSKKLHGTSK